MIPLVIVLDDSLTVRMDLAEALQSAGMRARPCASIADARDAMRTERASLAILDVLLPDGDGVSFLREIRATSAGASLPVLLLSSEAEVADRIRGLRTGANDYVGKPYDTAYVVARARELIGLGESAVGDDSPTVLVVDDSATFRDVLSRALVGAGYGVRTASSGEEGLRVAAVQRPAAIIVDSEMSGIGGITVIHRVRLDPALRGTPCLLITGSDVDRAELRALEAGADTFARKDEDLEVILARLAAALRGAGASRPETASLLGPKRILAVDDSPTYLHELASVLRREGYDVVMAYSGEAAIDMLSAQSVDCILMDLMMPGIGGMEACRRIKQTPRLRDTPLVMLTAREDRVAMIDGLSGGADDFIAKSGEFDVLKARVAAQVRRKQLEEEHRRTREELLQSEINAADARAARELAEARAVLADELVRKNRELEAFSYSVSHDLRAPLRTIDGFSLAMIEDYGGVLDDRALGYLRRVRNAAQRMGELIDDLLELSRVSRADLVRARVDVSQIARRVAADLARRHPDRLVDLVIQSGMSAHADGRQLQLLLENLLGNAWKFTGKVEQPRVEVGIERTDDGEAFFVRDNGAGFDMAHAAKLFGPFQRLHTEADFPGTGIGLATVHRVVDRHGGRVWAEGEVGRGAVVWFTLPDVTPAGIPR